MMVETEPARYEKAEVPSSIATTLCGGGGAHPRGKAQARSEALVSDGDGDAMGARW